ncbi:hypothetical protein QOT17_003861 [Balamuthia mandrillaris]
MWRQHQQQYEEEEVERPPPRSRGGSYAEEMRFFAEVAGLLPADHSPQQQQQHFNLCWKSKQGKTSTAPYAFGTPLGHGFKEEASEKLSMIPDLRQGQARALARPQGLLPREDAEEVLSGGALSPVSPSHATFSASPTGSSSVGSSSKVSSSRTPARLAPRKRLEDSLHRPSFDAGRYDYPVQLQTDPLLPVLAPAEPQHSTASAAEDSLLTPQLLSSPSPLASTSSSGLLVQRRKRPAATAQATAASQQARSLFKAHAAAGASTRQGGLQALMSTLSSVGWSTLFFVVVLLLLWGALLFVL